MEANTFWESIRNHSGWAWALGEIRRHPGRLDERGPRWGETALHWALLGSLEAVAEILPGRSDLLFSIDKEGRSPLDWAIEKIYFLKEPSVQSVDEEAKANSLIGQARSCALYALNWMSANGLLGAWSGNPALLLRCALAAGEIELAIAIEERMDEPAGADIWLSGLAGKWAGDVDAKAYMDYLGAKHGLSGASVAFGRPVGLHVAALWAEGKIGDEQAERLHRAGASIDQETEDESIEVFCSRSPKGAARLARLLAKLGI